MNRTTPIFAAALGLAACTAEPELSPLEREAGSPDAWLIVAAAPNQLAIDIVDGGEVTNELYVPCSNMTATIAFDLVRAQFPHLTEDQTIEFMEQIAAADLKFCP